MSRFCALSERQSQFATIVQIAGERHAHRRQTTSGRPYALGHHPRTPFGAHVVHAQLAFALPPPLLAHLVPIPRRLLVLRRVALLVRRLVARRRSRRRLSALVVRVAVARQRARHRRRAARLRDPRRLRSARDRRRRDALASPRGERPQTLLLGLLLLLRDPLLHLRAGPDLVARVAIGDVERLGQRGEAVVDRDVLQSATVGGQSLVERDRVTCASAGYAKGAMAHPCCSSSSTRRAGSSSHAALARSPCAAGCVGSELADSAGRAGPSSP